jgi:hypothetical protein
MNSLIENIEKLLNDSMTIFFEKICDKYENVDIEELKNLWNNNEIEPKKSVTKEKEKPKSTPVKKTKEKNDGCPYVFSKGQNSGNMCGSKSKTDSEYCSKHQKFEGVGQTKKAEVATKKSNSISEKSSSVKKKSPSVAKKPTERIIKHNKDIDKYWNAETQLVFKSKDDRVVYASFRNDELNELDDDDILLCEQYGFKYDRVPINDEEEEDVEEEDGAREEIEKQNIIIEAAAKNKKSLSNAIIENNLKAKCIEDVLNELQLDDDDEDEFVEEEVEEEVDEE